jgi:hypothetical protein
VHAPLSLSILLIQGQCEYTAIVNLLGVEEPGMRAFVIGDDGDDDGAPDEQSPD